MPEWTIETRKAIQHTDLENPENSVNIPGSIYEELRLADDIFRIQIHEDDEMPGTFYPYFVRMSGPLYYGETKNITGKDKKTIKDLSLAMLKRRLLQALEEIKKIEEK